MEGLTSDIVDQLASGNSEAFAAIYKAYAGKAFGRACQYLQNRHDAEDVCANVFMKLWENRRRFTTIDRIEAYLMVSVRNACFDLMRSARTRMSLNTVPLEGVDFCTRIEDTADVLTEYKERLKKKVEELPDQCRRIVKLAYFEDLKNQEIAAHLGISKKTVINQKMIALKILRIHHDALVSLSVLCWFLLQ